VTSETSTSTFALSVVASRARFTVPTSVLELCSEVRYRGRALDVGHRSAAFTLTVYGHLLEADLDELASRLDVRERKAQ
jgi:hypothetical protein